MTGTLKHKGTPIDFAVGTLIVPPLSLAFVEENADRIAAFGGGLGDSKLVVDCLYAALVRNYPDVTRPYVADLVDLGNLQDVMGAVMKVSGLVSAQEATDSGKVLAAVP